MMAGFPPYAYTVRFSWPFTVKETEQFSYEVDWEVEEWRKEKGSASRTLKKYLRKIRQSDGQVVASLLLGKDLETADESKFFANNLHLLVEGFVCMDESTYNLISGAISWKAQ